MGSSAAPSPSPPAGGAGKFDSVKAVRCRRTAAGLDLERVRTPYYGDNVLSHGFKKTGSSSFRVEVANGQGRGVGQDNDAAQSGKSRRARKSPAFTMLRLQAVSTKPSSPIESFPAPTAVLLFFVVLCGFDRKNNQIHTRRRGTLIFHPVNVEILR